MAAAVVPKLGPLEQSTESYSFHVFQGGPLEQDLSRHRAAAMQVACDEPAAARREQVDTDAV